MCLKQMFQVAKMFQVAMAPKNQWLLSWWNQESKAEGTLNYATDPKAGWLYVWYHGDEPISQPQGPGGKKSVT